ncbi:MAG: FadR/GntR family transcriptional regulator [Sphaerochaetaceae bacterium]
MNSKTAPFKPVATRKIYQYILEQFVNLVSTGVLKPGDKIPSERELAEIFSVSRPSVREALRVLEIIGLIDIQPGGGAYLKEMELGPFLSVIAPLLFSHENFELELLELRELVEMRAAELLPQTLTEEMLVPMRAALSDMRKALEENDKEAGALADIAFHRALVLMSDSFILQKTLELIVSLFEHSVRGGRSVVLERHEDAEQLMKEHQAIYDALLSNDREKARGLLGSHLQMVRNLYICP